MQKGSCGKKVDYDHVTIAQVCSTPGPAGWIQPTGLPEGPDILWQGSGSKDNNLFLAAEFLNHGQPQGLDNIALHSG